MNADSYPAGQPPLSVSPRRAGVSAVTGAGMRRGDSSIPCPICGVRVWRSRSGFLINQGGTPHACWRV